MAKSSDKDFLTPEQRAEDVILGALGFGEGATILSISATNDGFSGRGCWEDGEEFEFASEDELTDLDRWALGILLKKKRS